MGRIWLREGPWALGFLLQEVKEHAKTRYRQMNHQDQYQKVQNTPEPFFRTILRHWTIFQNSLECWRKSVAWKSYLKTQNEEQDNTRSQKLNYQNPKLITLQSLDMFNMILYTLRFSVCIWRLVLKSYPNRWALLPIGIVCKSEGLQRRYYGWSKNKLLCRTGTFCRSRKCIHIMCLITTRTFIFHLQTFCLPFLTARFHAQ